MTTPESFRKDIVIAAPLTRVWDCLTLAEEMKAWMGEPEMQLEIATDWGVGRPIIMRGFHHEAFENLGMVLEFHPLQRLAYTHLSSSSRLVDIPENYSRFEFSLIPSSSSTSVSFLASGFPTEAIFRHLQFYWSGALEALRRHTQQD